MSYYKYFTVDGVRYCYSSYASYRCPNDPRDTRGEVPYQVVQALAAVGLDALVVLRRAHTGSRQIHEGRCVSCGAEAIKLGYASWIERPLEPGEDPFASGIARGLGGTAAYRKESLKHHALKREAIAWARDEADIARRTLKESRA